MHRALSVEETASIKNSNYAGVHSHSKETHLKASVIAQLGSQGVSSPLDRLLLRNVGQDRLEQSGAGLRWIVHKVVSLSIRMTPCEA
jgi:hypothetical protein